MTLSKNLTDISIVTHRVFFIAEHSSQDAMNQETIKRLLAAGADLNARTEWGDTAAHYAALTGSYTALRHLIEQGIQVDKPIRCKCNLG